MSVPISLRFGLACSLPPKALFTRGHFRWTASHYRFARKVLARWLRRTSAR